jgi:hypothetical protein
MKEEIEKALTIVKAFSTIYLVVKGVDRSYLQPGVHVSGNLAWGKRAVIDADVV